MYEREKHAFTSGLNTLSVENVCWVIQANTFHSVGCCQIVNHHCKIVYNELEFLFCK